MRLLSILLKSLREQWRDIWTLVLTLSLAPAFVVTYWLLFGGGSTRYDVLVLNRDAGSHGDGVIAALKTVIYEDGQSMLKVRQIDDRSDAERKLKDRKADLLLIIPEDFSQALQGGDPAAAQLTMVGDLTNTYYAVAAVLTQAALDGYLQVLSDQPRPVAVVEEALGDSGARSEFEIYIPGLLIFAVLMLIYQSSMVVAREVEAGTLARLRITPMTALDLLGGISLSQIVIGVTGLVIAFLTAVALGFDSQGPLWVAVMVGAVTSLSCVGIGLLMGCFVRTVSQAFIVSNFPLFLMMFFSGAFFPMGDAPLFTVGGRTIQLYDFLPPSHAVTALNKVLTLGEGPGEIVYELSALLVLSAVYFAAGVWLFQRTHLRRR